ncbi:acyl-CoA dehydrogenase family protein [Streptomyces malaysiensis]|uniref:acyl-CoA dehydrogenase family protein n=1 Tax=Streptomyces malaysiensis TaxID=92644 RepID=UPI00131AC6AE|nr:acyl-CoA dehydrogenase family protein [Streptomyces malaysiensis]
MRLGAAAVAAGTASGAVAEAATYAAGRHQFGGPITALPTVRASLFDQTARAAAVLAADTRDTFVAAAALTCAYDAAVDVPAAAPQVHGGYGHLKEYPAEPMCATPSPCGPPSTPRASPCPRLPASSGCPEPALGGYGTGNWQEYFENRQHRCSLANDFKPIMDSWPPISAE